MRSVIEGAGRSEMLFIGPATDDGSAEIVVARAYEGMDCVRATVAVRRLHGLFPMAAIFTKCAESEVERLAVARTGTVNSVENPCDAGDDRKP